MKNKLLVIGIIIGVLCIAAGFILAGGGEPIIGSQVRSSTTLVQAFQANYASVSATADDDIISYSIDAPTVASLSVGEIIMFKSGGIEAMGITANYPYYVFTASTSTGFEIASSSDSDAALDIQAAGTGGEFFYELPSIKNGDSPLIDVADGKYTTTTVDCDGSRLAPHGHL